MNPYLSFAIAMCFIVLIALAGTAYMAVWFNRRAKADLAAALQPLSQAIDGQIDLEDASVKGRFDGHIAEGRAATAPGGAGRVFHSLVIDGAGGNKWLWSVSRSKDVSAPSPTTFEGGDDAVQASLRPLLDELAQDPRTGRIWLRVEYDPAPGHVRLTRPMQTRRDIPNAEAFRGQLEWLVRAAAANRAAQQGAP